MLSENNKAVQTCKLIYCTFCALTLTCNEETYREILDFGCKGVQTFALKCLFVKKKKPNHNLVSEVNWCLKTVLSRGFFLPCLNNLWLNGR